MKNFIALAALAFLVEAARASPLPPIMPFQARSSEGQCVSVEGTAIVHEHPLRPGMDVVLGSGNERAIGFIPYKNEPVFPDVQRITGQFVDITGVIQFFITEPEIKMTEAHQLMLASDFHRRRMLVEC